MDKKKALVSTAGIPKFASCIVAQKSKNLFFEILPLWFHFEKEKNLKTQLLNHLNLHFVVQKALNWQLQLIDN